MVLKRGWPAGRPRFAFVGALVGGKVSSCCQGAVVSCANARGWTMTRLVDREGLHGAAPLARGPAFTYSRPEQPPFRRLLIRGIEVLSGRRRFEAIYQAWRHRRPERGVSVFTSAMRALKTRVDVSGAGLQGIPAAGGLLVIANHPFGILDGLAVGDLVSRVRPDVKVMVHSLLCQPVEARDVLLPVDFGASAEARRTSAETRRRAADWVRAGHVLVIFPAGSVSTAPGPFAARAIDCDWHPFVGRLAGVPGVRVLPIFVQGQNSRLFQLASHLSYPARVALIFYETRRQMRRGLQITVGRAETLPAELRSSGRLRRMVYELAGDGGPDPEQVFRWPRHIRF